MIAVNSSDRAKSPLLAGIGFNGYRSAYSGLCLVGPMGRVTMLAGPNNAGKSTILSFVRRLGRGKASQDEHDMPQVGDDRQISAELAVAFRSDDERLAQIHEKFPGLKDGLHRFLAQPPFRLTQDDLVWVRYAPTAKSGWGPSPDQAVEAQRSAMHLARDLSTELTKHSGGEEGADATRVLGVVDPIRWLPPIELIDAFRQIRALGERSEAGYDGAGLIDKLQQLQNPPSSRKGDKERFAAINKFLQVVLDDEQVELEVQHDRSSINVTRGQTMLPLRNYGTGVHQVTILAAAATVLENHVICIEEPEIHLHPILQRKLVRYLADNTSNQYLIATHSAALLDYERATIFSVRSTAVGMEVLPATTPADLWTVCADLGYRPSDLLQANAVIWVEGPSDRTYINHWLEQRAPEFTEGIDYSIMFYGGRLLSHLTADDPWPEQLISLRRLNRSIAIVIDADTTSAEEPLSATKQRLVKEMNDPQQPGLAWVTDGYTIESYVPPAMLRSAVATVHADVDLAWDGDRWANPLSLVKRPDKVRIAKAVCQNWDQTSWTDELRQHVDGLVKFIRSANHS